MPNKLNAPNFNDSLYSVHSFINAFISNLIEAIRPKNSLCIDESINSWLGKKNKIPGHHKILQKLHLIGQDGCTIVGDSWFELPKLCLLLMESGLYSIFYIKKRCGWPLNYPQDMIQKLGNAYRSYCLKVAVVNSMHLIAASLKDQKPQCIIATASTTTQGDKVERVVKEHNNSLLVKFA
ncbi:1199_t:CDS:2 [Gigaspora margarita]|uniref:1199_t:CDS:1 n=1 Tax=Gigaspora margarita TaxID=4874 RepID=A0ABN7WXI8_GIGMA|nr:1199_t:CDS:2 [Gigaspora margarita]